MIHRNKNQAWIGGIAAGLAEDYGMPTGVVRVAFVVGYLLFGLGLAIYLWLWNKSENKTGQLGLI